MSSLLDQVEAKVVRAKRAFTRSRKIIIAARNDLESHQRWLDRHRAAWSEDVKRHQPLLNSNMPIRAFMRFAFGLPLLAPFVCLALFRRIGGSLAQALRLTLNEKLSDALQLSFAETRRVHTRHAQLQHRIRELDGPLITMKPVVLSIGMRGKRSPITIREAFRLVATVRSLEKGKVLISALGVITLFLIAAGAVRATMPGLPAEAPVPVSPNVSGSTQPAAALPATAPTVPPNVVRPALWPPLGFSVLEAALVPEPQQLSAPTPTSMMLITVPLAVAPTEPDATRTLVAEEAPAVKPKVKASLKRKLARQEPQQQLSWWQRLPWMRVR